MRFLIFFLFACMAPVSTYAQTVIDQAGADALKPRIEALVAQHEASLKSAGATLTHDGDVIVEPAETYYAITSPALIITTPDGTARNIGMVSINAIPTDDPDVFKVAVALPTPIIDINAEGRPVRNLSIGTQSMNGLFHLAAGTFIDMTGAYKNISYTDQINGIELSIPALTTKIKLNKRGQGEWSGPSETVIAGMDYADKNSTYTIETLRVKTSVDRLDILASNVFRENLKKSLLQHSEGEVIPSHAAKKEEITNLIGKYITEFAHGGAMEMEATALTFSTKNQKGQTHTGKVANALLSTSASDLKSESAKAAWNVDINGIAFDNQALVNFMPTRIAIKGNGDGLPMKNMIGIEKGDMKDVLSQSTGALNIDQILIDAPNYGFEAKGNFKSDATSQFGSIGGFNISLRGVESLLEWMASPSGPQAFGIPTLPPGIMAAISVLHMTGQQGTDSQGRPSRNYDFKLGADGKMKLNGADLSSMFGGLQAKAASQ